MMGFQIFTADFASERDICKKKKKGRYGHVEEEKYSDKEGVNRKCVKNEKTCQREVER